MPTLVYSIIVVVLMAVAVLIGERVHRRRPATPDEQHGGFSLDLLAGATLTLAVIMCSFMLAVTYSSYDASNHDAADEAGAVAGLYEACGLLPDRAAAQQIQQATICYARSIVSDEWSRMGEPGFTGSAQVDHWRADLGKHIRDADSSGASASALTTVRDADVTRTQTRQVRLVTADTHAPVYLYLLLVMVCAVAMFVVTAFTVRGMPRALRLPIVVLLSVLLSATLVIIDDLDHSFTGVSTISAGYVADVGDTSSALYHTVWGVPVEACDAAGRLPA